MDLWDGRLKGGNYIVRCNSIIALSKHEYISDGVARVVEVNSHAQFRTDCALLLFGALQAGDRQ
jgi:hypothetical protein